MEKYYKILQYRGSFNDEKHYLVELLSGEQKVMTDTELEKLEKEHYEDNT